MGLGGAFIFIVSVTTQKKDIFFTFLPCIFHVSTLVIFSPCVYLTNIFWKSALCPTYAGDDDTMINWQHITAHFEIILLWKVGKIKNEINRMLRQRIRGGGLLHTLWKMTLKLRLQGEESAGKYSGSGQAVGRIWVTLMRPSSWRLNM